MSHDRTVVIPADPEDVFYDPHGWAYSSGFPVAVLDGHAPNFVMRRIQDRAVRLMYELPHGTAFLTSYPRPMPSGQVIEIMEGNLATLLTAPLVGGRTLQLATVAPSPTP